MRLFDERYEEIKQDVVDLYEELHITKFPVNVKNICKRLGIGIKSYNQLDLQAASAFAMASEDGVMTKIDNHYEIFYSTDKSKERIRFTILHEIGHIRLRHLVHDEENEAEANFFASYFLAPVPLIHHFNLKSKRDVMDKFWTTEEFAEHAFDRYEKWLKYSNPGFTKYEKKI